MQVLDAQTQHEGGGFVVHRPFPTMALDGIDPFLLFDHMGPTDYGPGEAVGAPDHPHRGFETVTYMLNGSFEHRDSHGNHGILKPGDVQWMTAGDGVVHSEMPEEAFRERGGLMEGVQLWVNLPRADKRIPPRYQDIPKASIPEAEVANQKGTVRVIAGQSHGVSAVIDTRTPIQYLHFILQPGARIEQAVPADHNAFAYVLSGEAWIADTGQRVRTQQCALLSDGDTVALGCPDDAQQEVSLLLLSGRPIREPVARWGPFVMNDNVEIHQAIQDYQMGRFGAIDASSASGHEG